MSVCVCMHVAHWSSQGGPIHIYMDVHMCIRSITETGDRLPRLPSQSSLATPVLV